MLVQDPKATPAELDTVSVMYCKLWNAELDHEETAMPEIGDRPPQRRLMGTLVASPFVGRDEFGVEGCFFLFPDLSCRTTGKYRLKFVLVVLNPANIKIGDRLPPKATVLSDVFEVYPAKTFPGIVPSTELTIRLKEQGCLISVKKGHQRIEMTTEAHPNEEHEHEDEKSSEIFQILNDDFEGATRTTPHNRQNMELSEQSRRSSISNASDISQASSLYSIANSISSLASASSKSSVVSTGGEQLVVILLGDPVLQPLCVEALTMMTLDRFERNLRRLLKVLGTELRKEAEGPYQKSAARFICYSARNSAHIIRNTLDFKHSEVYTQPGFSMITALKPDPERDDEYASDASSGSNGLDDDVPDVQIIEQFITNSQAFASFRVQLRNFVYPEDLKGRPRVVGKQPKSGDPEEEPALTIKQPLAELDLEESQPMNAYQIEGLKPMEPAQRPNWKSILTENLARYLPNLQSIIAQEPKVPAGKARIRWKCVSLF